MAKRFSAKRLKPLKNLQGKRYQKRVKTQRVRKDDLFALDENVAPRVVDIVKAPPKPYVTQRQRYLEKDLKELAKPQSQAAPTTSSAFAEEKIANIWAYTPLRNCKKRKVGLLEKLTVQLPDSSYSYNPDPTLHYQALDQAAHYILENNIAEKRIASCVPRTVSRAEENAESLAIFMRLAGQEYEEAEVVPVEVEKSKIEYQAHRTATLQAIEAYEKLKEQLGEQTLSGDALKDYAYLRRAMYREFEDSIPQLQIKKCKTQKDEIQQFINFYTPYKIEEVIKMKQVAYIGHMLNRDTFRRTGKLFPRDFPLLEAEELGSSLKNIRAKGSPFHDQINDFINKRTMVGTRTRLPVKRQVRYKLGFKWWDQ